MIIHDCEQNSDEWLKLRCGIPTSSAASKLVTSTGEPSKQMKDYAEMLAGELMAMDTYGDGQIDDFAGNKHTERGHELEGEALAYYSFITGSEIIKVGFVTTDDLTAGSSPDGMVGDDGMVEVKCLGYKAHIKALRYIKKHGKVPTDYIAQKNDQMLVCERLWCDSIFYHPKLPTVFVRDYPDAAITNGLIAQKQKLFKERELALADLKAVYSWGGYVGK